MDSIDMPGATIFFGDFPGPSLFEQLKAETQWQQRRMMMFGKMVPQPRLTAWYGDPGASYSYSGIRNDPLPWTPLLSQLRDQLEVMLGHRFNSVLINLYRSGRDSIGFHADDERELGPEPVIASLSYGATREFVFQHRAGAEPDVVLDLHDSSLLIMMGETQKNWKHGIHKTKADGQRINLTFRTIF